VVQGHEATETGNDTETIDRKDQNKGVISVADSLFFDNLFDEFLQGKHKSVWREVDGIPQESFLGMSDSEVADYLIPRLEIGPLVLHEESMTQTHRETKIQEEDYGRIIQVDGLEITLSIPYSGDIVLWGLKTNPSRSHPKGIVFTPEANGIGHVEISFKVKSSCSPEHCKKQVDGILDVLRYYLGIQGRQISGFNQNLRATIQEATRIRRERLGKHAAMVQSLNIPLKRREGVPDLSQIPIKRRLVKPLPTLSPGQQPEPGISDEAFEHILGVIRHEGRTFEATPETFLNLDEGELRNIIMAHLNGHYEGDATGETFRRSGKTDIRIENQERAAFVAECKVWHGASEFPGALDQLLGYLTWRDCKTALIFFNKQNAGFKQIQDQISGLLNGHLQYQKFIPCNIHGEWRCVFRSMDDPERKVIVHTFVFNLFVKK